ncbi:glycosyl transferase [Synechococcus lacustris]|uniref:glycosyl transferase n=1 Tax=Synechococcus lacustris TaxID=2116544 RepID=UPI0020CCAF31|nr:glycosyl transferase [Synechococcus lacustris]MCP9812115.1 glycosyl transferase [Synechococcus lacustris Maggiore-St4-Slac]
MTSVLRVQVSPSASEPTGTIVLVCNGPGELTTWVRPLAQALHRLRSLRPLAPGAAENLRLVLVPCPNATGTEHRVANAMGLFERVIAAREFWWLLLQPKRYGPWPTQGVVVFLGGDQFWTVLLSARLGYRHITYAEWVARWPQWNDRIAAMGEAAANQLAPRWQQRCTVVGDLMADLTNYASSESQLAAGEWVALMPGSKRAKLQVGVPFMLRCAELLQQMRPQVRFLLPVAPTTSVAEIINYGSPSNPLQHFYGNSTPQLLERDGERWLKSWNGCEILLIETQPAHHFLSQCSLALTTVGANTAELGALSVPMLVLVPTQHLHVMQAWDGWLGLLARLPLLRWLLGVALTTWRMRHRGFLAWPNISAGHLVVPERVGTITPEGIAKEAEQWLANPHKLQSMAEELRNLRGKSGAVAQLAAMVDELLAAKKQPPT